MSDIITDLSGEKERKTKHPKKRENPCLAALPQPSQGKFDGYLI